MANEIRVEKCFYDLNEYMDYSGFHSGFLTQAEVPYLVFGAEEELAALNAVREASPETLENLTRQTLEISERINQDIFKVLVTYEMDVFGGSNGDNEPEPSFAFDTGGGSKHVNQSIATVSKTPSDAPDYGGAISVDSEGNVNGIDITMPVMNFSETHYFRASKVTTAYKKRLAELTGTVNNGKFKGYAPGEESENRRLDHQGETRLGLPLGPLCR